MAPTGVSRLLEPFAEDGSLNVVIESPRGSTAKWKYEAGVFRLSRPLPAGLVYPYDWGFVPGTRASDGDPLDAMVYWNGSGYPGVVVPSQAIGVLRIEQTNRESGNRERNDRLLVVPVNAPALGVSSALDLPDRVRSELEHFFIAAVAFEGKDLKVLGWGDAEEATDAIAASGARR